ncbi:MAG: hypothetical protein WBA13_20585 [Microcoleaceae cyanobacterium]
MSVTSILNEVVQNLEEDPNLIRIKKILFCACYSKWENDYKKLQDISVESLVKELYWKTQNIDTLYKIFDKILSKINKKTEYSLVINTILERVSKLYLEANEAKKEETDLPWLVNGSELIQEQDLHVAKQALSSNNSKTLFEVRFKLMQHSNPLKVKILIFSAIEQEFNFSSQDWLQLRSISLDQLLEKLIKTFPNLSMLESHLNKVSCYLDQSDEMLQVATIIIESIKPLYENRSSVQNIESKKKVAVGVNYQSKDIHIKEDFQPNLEEQSFNHRAVYQSFNSSNLHETETLHLTEVESYHPLKSLPIQHFKSAEEIESELSSSYSGVSSECSSNYAQLHQELPSQLLQIEEEIEQKIDQSVAFAMNHMKTLLKDLEIEVEGRLQNYSVEVQTSTQHEALKKFINHFQAQIIEFDRQLNHSEQAEINPHYHLDPDHIKPESMSDHISPPSNQNQMMELAKQGNCQAITTLINQSLNPRGINTLTKVRNGCLHIFLESEAVTTKESTAQFVHKKLIFLKIKSIQSIKIYGRKTGNKAINWVQEFTYNYA